MVGVCIGSASPATLRTTLRPSFPRNLAALPAPHQRHVRATSAEIWQSDNRSATLGYLDSRTLRDIEPPSEERSPVLHDAGQLHMR